jgi:hypothetical protein
MIISDCWVLLGSKDFALDLLPSLLTSWIPFWPARLSAVLPMSSHKRKQGPPQLVVHGTASAVSSCSNDERRQQTTVGVVPQSAGPSKAVSGEYWAEDLAANAARLGDDFTYRLGDDSLESQQDDIFDNGTSLADGITVLIKEPRYANSVCLWYFLAPWISLIFGIGSSSQDVVPQRGRILGQAAASQRVGRAAHLCTLCRAQVQ